MKVDRVELVKDEVKGFELMLNRNESGNYELEWCGWWVRITIGSLVYTRYYISRELAVEQVVKVERYGLECVAAWAD